jgi:hypothetical protein
MSLTMQKHELIWLAWEGLKVYLGHSRNDFGRNLELAF